MAIMSPPREVPSGGNSGTASKRNSHSKIPVSTRRLSATSDSGHSSSSTRASSAMDRYNTPKVITPRGLSSLPKPMQQIPVSPLRHSPSPAMVKSPGRRDMGQKPTSSPLLKANIIAPPPKKSPPLRSSRPRQPVSTASTSASRAKMVERLNTLETQDRFGKDRTKSKQGKMLPELGKVDFAARRQKIQQAFNKTVQENQLKEERAAERRRLAHEQQERDHQQILASQQTPTRPMEQQSATDDEENDAAHEEEETFATPNEEFPQRQLTIDTSNVPGQRTVKDAVRYNDDDSPTLGVPSNVATANTEFPPSASDMPPMSAITTDTMDTADTAETDSTTFDNEPQTDRPLPNPLHRTVLSQIMQMRESSPGSQSHSDHGDDSLSERDDKESIQIMLRETPAEEIPSGFEHTLTGEDKDRQSNEVPPNRLSTSSWTSSIRDRQSTDWAADGPMERIEETSPQPDSSDHHSFTTADSNHTPQSWSPATFTSPQTTHSTTDSAVGQSLPLHRDPALLSPVTRQSYIQQILTQSPDLARQGGWDPKRVTQLYLQELARGTSRRQAVPAPLKLQHRETEESAQEGGSPGQLSPEMARERTSEDSRPSMDSLDYEASSSPIEQRVIHRASMNSREDWEHNSPSVLEWMHPEGYEDSPVDNSEPSDGPTPPPKELTLPDREGAETPRVTTNGPKLPEIDTGGALGLAIHVQSPQDTDSPTIPPPPLPTHSPPPPPPVRSKSADVVVEPTSSNSISPSIYDSNLPSSIFPTVTTAGIITGMTARGSGDSAQPSFANASVPDSTSSTQDHPSFDQRPSTDTQAKASTTTPEQRQLNKRRHVIKELIDTEHSFGRDMKVVDDIYKGTSSSCLDLSVEDVKILFSNSDQIVQFSMNFLDALKQAGKPIYVMPKAQRYKSTRASTATGTSGTVDETASVNGTELSDEDKDRQTFVGAVFGQNMARMEKVYAEYLKNHDAANKKLQALQQNPKVTIWLKECRQWAADLTTAWDLDSLLVKPVQRVLKYPLLLAQLLEATPEDHPDFTAIDVAVREMTGVSFRINEMKKRADVVEQVINSRKRKESDVRTGLQKAFGRRTEKLRQQVGLSDMFEDRQYNMLEEKFGSNFFQLQVVMRDVEMYTSDVQNYMNRFYDFVQAIEAYIDVGQSSHPEMESKWRKFRMSVKEISATALAEHVSWNFGWDLFLLTGISFLPSARVLSNR
jgi:dynamin-binding protein